MSETHRILRKIRSFLDQHDCAPGYKSLERHCGLTRRDVENHFTSLSEATQQAERRLEKPQKQFHLYAVELNPKVWADKPGFRKKNPQFTDEKLPTGVVCYYVGYTTKPTPEDRVRKHLEGGKTSGRRIVTHYIRDRTRLVVERHTERNLPFRSKEHAEAQEKALAQRLQKEGHAVYCDQLRQRKEKSAFRNARARKRSR
jgi:hypothetical protein